MNVKMILGFFVCVVLTSVITAQDKKATLSANKNYKDELKGTKQGTHERLKKRTNKNKDKNLGGEKGPDGEQDFVSFVDQNYNDRVNNQLGQVVNRYNKLEFAYRAYASYYTRADISLPGFAKFFKSGSKYMMEQASKLTEYINTRGGFLRFHIIKLPEICQNIEDSLIKSFKAKEMLDSPPTNEIFRTKARVCRFATKKPMKNQNRDTWQHGLYGLEDALEMEKLLQADLYKAIEIAKLDSTKDLHAKHHLEHDHLNPERVKSTADLVSKLRKYVGDNNYELGQYELDKELS